MSGQEKEVDYVGIKEVAIRLGYSVSYVRNHWSQLLPGVEPKKLGVNRVIRFDWKDIKRLLNTPK